MRRRTPLLLIVALLLPRAAVAPAPKLCGPPECCGLAERLEMGSGRAGNSQIKGPTNVTRAGVEDWLRRMEQLRERCTAAIGYDGSISAVPELKWTLHQPADAPLRPLLLRPGPVRPRSVCPVASE